LDALLRVIRLALPRGIRQRLRRALFAWLELTWTTSSGIGLRVANYNEWVIYNEIFVDGEYDAAIAAAIGACEAGRPLRVIDLGANTGFFTLRMFDRLRTAGMADSDCRITLVEANPALVSVLRARVHDDNPLVDRADIVSGAAGAPAGRATLYLSHESPGDSSVMRPTAAATVEIPYVDLARLAGDGAIDLLKCDIEGAELAVVDCYPQLLRRTRVAVFEFHHDLVSVDRCRDLLRAAGLAHETVLRDRGGHSLRMFTSGIRHEDSKQLTPNPYP
jgi:FkbM family methyltransferase